MKTDKHCNPGDSMDSGNFWPGFTLVELLVVVGIIGVLVSILIPALGKAQKAAQTIKCMSNLRQIGQALQIYLSTYGGYIPGGPATTSAWDVSGWNAQGPTEKYVPFQTWTTLPAGNPGYGSIMGPYDWESPLAQLMSQSLDIGPLAQNVLNRFSRLNASDSAFSCPANQISAIFYSNSNPFYPAANLTFPYSPQMPSYVEAMGFVLNGAVCQQYGVYVGGSDFVLPRSYGARATQIGIPSSKIYVADGARWSSDTGSGSTGQADIPDISLGWDPGGEVDQTCSFADPGPFDSYGHSWNLNADPVNGGAQYDVRFFAYRHGVSTAFARGTNVYRFNALFFDGHVETLGDLEGSNPNLWVPKGTIITQSSTYAHTWQTFAPSSGQFIAN